MRNRTEALLLTQTNALPLGQTGTPFWDLDFDLDEHCKCDTPTGPSPGYSVSGQGGSTRCFRAARDLCLKVFYCLAFYHLLLKLVPVDGDGGWGGGGGGGDGDGRGGGGGGYQHRQQFLLARLYWAIQAGLLTPLTFARHRLSPLAAFTSGAYFLHNGRR